MGGRSESSPEGRAFVAHRAGVLEGRVYRRLRPPRAPRCSCCFHAGLATPGRATLSSWPSSFRGGDGGPGGGLGGGELGGGFDCGDEGGAGLGGDGGPGGGLGEVTTRAAVGSAAAIFAAAGGCCEGGAPWDVRVGPVGPEGGDPRGVRVISCRA